MSRRKPRIDLGASSESGQQQGSNRDEEIRERKRKRWATVNKHRSPEENPFLAAIKPNHDNYGEPGESNEELQVRLESLEFGNYPGYFNYRNKAATASTSGRPDTTLNPTTSHDELKAKTELPLSDGVIDERLRYMKEDWFKGKNVLDVGCNRGHVTYALAKLFSPKFILGIDIDLKMINMANRDLHHHLESDIIKGNIEYRIKRAYKLTPTTGQAGVEATGNGSEPLNQVYPEDKLHFPISSYVSRGPLAVSIAARGQNDSQTSCDDCNNEPSGGGSDQLAADDRSNRVEPQFGAFPNNILFVEHNYVLSRDELVDKQMPHFDTIVCLSVTKWIHLNYRDSGLKRFFKRMHKHLNEGGLLVLESQPFDNYHRKKKLSERLRTNFNSIQFKPEHFDEFLLGDEVGFRRIIFSTTTEHECAGFKRPIKVFLK